MIPPPPVSVIIVSNRRAAALRRCLLGLTQLDHTNFEVVVVVDRSGRAVVKDLGLSANVKVVGFDLANISEGRNRGLAVAAGDVVAFIDDDAVPEPTWLTRLVAPFADHRVTAATGYVRGRNGISFQYQAGWIDALGRAHRLEADPEAVSLHQSEPGAAVKTEGTNMAFRRAVIAVMGGFDPSFRFFHDETDLNMRQAHAAHITAVVPLAQVHHGFAASTRRRHDRVPLTLREVGASTAIFLRKHAATDLHDRRLGELWREQRARLLRHMVSGNIEPHDVDRLLQTLRAGIDEGRRRTIRPLSPIRDPQQPFLPFVSAGPRPGRVLAGWKWQGRRLHREAQEHVSAGAVVTVFRFSPGAHFHRMEFHPEGYWLQAGGLWGRSERTQPLIRMRGIGTRLREEIARIATLRQVDSLLG